ncbi:MAG: sorbosone dehydrogenase family protein [Ekhidna sp.]|nr:sorbosone dehydrogenase family protein [Ekhidna sp.]MBC6426236.1 sorbosone dehydrogenase family protein [Ekhidna sp.]
MFRICQFLFTLLLIACSAASPSDDSEALPKKLSDELPLNSNKGLRLEDIKLPDGFKIDVYARVNNARSLALTPNGTLFVGNRGGDKVYALKDTDGDWKADKRYVVAEGLRMPNGIAYKEGSLYVAEVSRLWRFDDVEEHLTGSQKPVLIYDDYPKDGHHGWKYISFGPDGKLYVPVGAPCNICESKNEWYASITRMNPDGSDREVYAHGVRNTVGFTWHPETGEMWFTDNGRDWLGNDEPPCELNRVTEAGQHFGYPYCHGGYFKDPEFGDKYPCTDFVKPAQNLGPHVAPLGIKFCTSDAFPEQYRLRAFIAEHGSWNRDQEVGHTGHKIVTVSEENGIGTAYEDFATGFLDPATNKAWARPVDLVFTPDGSMLLSDDLAGTVFRIWYSEI